MNLTDFTNLINYIACLNRRCISYFKHFFRYQKFHWTNIEITKTQCSNVNYYVEGFKSSNLDLSHLLQRANRIFVFKCFRMDKLNVSTFSDIHLSTTDLWKIHMKLSNFPMRQIIVTSKQAYFLKLRH